MKYVYPDYYKNFKCIKGECRHNCCIGWEIDIDESSAERYRALGGDMGKRLRKNIDFSATPHFILGQNARCPFLNKDNLCDIITMCGKDSLCKICAEHPRFHNRFDDRTESGLGLCCEAAARLILGRDAPVRFISDGADSDEVFILRDKVISLLQDRTKSLPDRIDNMLLLCDAQKSQKSLKKWADLLIGLERLNEKWGKLLSLLKEKPDLNAFGKHMAGRTAEYEQFLVYLIYRHFIAEGASVVATFTSLWYKILYHMGASLYEKNGEFTFEDQVELARMFSSEIEYSDENLDIILEELEIQSI